MRGEKRGRGKRRGKSVDERRGGGKSSWHRDEGKFLFLFKWLCIGSVQIVYARSSVLKPCVSPRRES
jgi:hypothetical protein